MIYFANKIDSIKNCIRILTEEGVPEADIEEFPIATRGKTKTFRRSCYRRKTGSRMS